MAVRPGHAHTIDAAVLAGMGGRAASRLLYPALAAVACAGWTVATLGGAANLVPRAAPYVDWLLPSGPLVLGLMALLARPHSPSWLKLAFAWTVTFAAALESLLLVGDNIIFAFAPAVLGLAAVAANRWPAPTVLALFALAGTYGSVEAFTPISAGITSDLLLVAGWLALAWGWVTGRREPPRWLPLSLALLVGYLVVTAVFVLLAGEFEQAAYSFRASAWLMTGAILIAYFLPQPRQQAIVHQGILVATALVGGYAMLRWVIGPAAKEEAPLIGNAFVQGDNGEIRLFGSLPDPQSLGIWCATIVPFTLASALAPIAVLWRLVALVAAGLCGAAIQGSDSRSAILGAAIGSAAVFALFAAGRGFHGRKALPLALGLILLISGGGVFAATKLADDGSAGTRFRGLLDPLHDESVQGRLVKWQTILSGIDELPFGHGLGSSGAAEVKYARFSSSATFDPDSTYVKVAFDQGILVLLLFIGVLIALILGLGQRAIRAPDARGGALAVGACGALVAFAVMMGAGVYFESLLGASPWLLVGLAMAPFVRELSLRRSPGT